MELIVLPHKVERTKNGAYVGVIDWCKVLSTRAHRSCTAKGCDCQCHRTFNAENYGSAKNNTAKYKMAQLRRVKRLG